MFTKKENDFVEGLARETKSIGTNWNRDPEQM